MRLKRGQSLHGFTPWCLPMQPTEDHKKKTVKLDHLNYATEEDMGLWPTFWRGLGLVVQASGQDLRNLALVNVITAWGPAVSLFFSKV